jgi:hypothetical protein
MTCLVSNCTAAAGYHRRVCERHWRQIPGLERSRLSLGVNFPQSSRTDQAWAKAIEGIDNEPRA